VGPNDTENNTYATAITPEIQSLANSLNNDPQLIYEYVLNNIDYVPYLGSLKGATLTYLDRSGNDYDQASLLIALLQAAGQTTATFASGQVNYPIFNGPNNYDMQHWLGFDLQNAYGNSSDATAIANIIYNSGYNSVWYNNNTITMDRIWVQVTINGTTYQLDPAFKSYQGSSGLSLASLTSAAGYTRSSLMGAAGGGTDPSVAQNMNEPALDTALNGYAMNLASYLQANYPNSDISSIVGGRQVNRVNNPQLTTAIQYGVVSSADCSVNYYHTVNIQHGGINQTFTLPTIAARRLAMTYNEGICSPANGSAYETTGWNFGTVCPTNTSSVSFTFPNSNSLPVTYTGAYINVSNSNVFLFPSGSSCTAAPNSTCSIAMEVEGSSYGTPAESNMTATLQVTLTASGYNPATVTYPLIVSSVVAESEATLLLDDVVQASETTGSAASQIQVQVTHPYLNTTAYNDSQTYTVTRGGTYVFASEFGGSQAGQVLRLTQGRLAAMLAGSLSATSQQEMIETLNVAGQTWLRETTLNTAFGAWATNNWYTVQHRIGLAGQSTFYYVDIRNQVGVVTGNTGASDPGLMTKLCGLVPSSMEHGVLEQLQYGSNAVSTVKILSTANAAGQEIFMANSSNFSSIWPQLSNYSATDESNFETDIGKTGGALILPQNGQNTINQWTGEGYIAYSDTGSTSTIAMIIGGGVAGGYNCTTGDINSQQACSQGTALTGNQGSAKSDPCSNEPIDLVTGAYTLSHQDLKLGDAAPLGLALSRSYTSQNSSQQTPEQTPPPMGYGWRHSYDISLSTYSDGETPLGYRRHVDAAPAILTAIVIADLMTDTSTDPATAQKWLAGALAAKWLTDDNLLNRSVSLYYGEKVMTFTELPNGTFVSPPGVTSTLVYSGGVYNLQNRDGSTLTFTSVGTSGNDFRASSLTDANGNTMSFAYSGTLLSTVTDAFGRTLTFTYNGNLVSQVKDSFGRVVKYGYDGSSDLTSYTDADSNLWGYGYGAGQGLLTTLVDPLSETLITNTYDTNSYGAQRRVTTQAALRQNNQTGTYKIFVNDYRSAQVDPYGYADVYFYDREGRTPIKGSSLSTAPDVAANRFTMAYDGQYHTTQSTDPDNNTTNYTYDGNNNLTQTTDPLNNLTTYSYDPTLFRITGATDPLNHSVNYAYTDSAHPYSVTQTTTYPSSSLTVNTYTAYGGPKGLPSSAIDGRNTTTNPTYTLSGSWISGISSKTGSHQPVQKSLDQAGRMTQLVDPLGSTYGLAYNYRDLVLTATDPFNKTTTNTYYSTGNLQTTTDRNGGVTTYGYTPSSKVQSIAYPGNLNVSLTYDLGDKLTAMIDSMGGTSYGYDGYNRLNSVTDAQGATVGYTYDAAGNLTQLTYPGGKTVGYTYDALNRLKTVTINWLSGTPVATYFYDNAGRITGISQFNGTIVTPGYDNANRMTSLNNYANGSVMTGYIYTLDNNGNRTTINATGALPPANVAQNISYTYSSTGNRLTNFSSTALSYDNDGQLQTEGSTSYTFDGANRLTAYGTSSFSYDGANHRLKATRSGTTNKYVYDAAGHLLVEEDGNGNILMYFIYGKGLLAWVDASGNMYCYHFDGNGNTVAVTDVNQKVVNKYSYSPYGVVEGRFELKPQPFTYVGQYGVYDESGGIYCMRARYYDANAKRFISEDPMGLGGGDTNLYTYVKNSPLMRIDPLGMCIEEDLVSEAIGTAAIAAGIVASGVLAGAEVIEEGLVTVTHFSDAAGVQAITESGTLRAGTYVTLPGEASGMTASEVESALEIQPGRGAFSTSLEVPQSQLTIPENGPLTSGGKIQFQLTEPATPGPFRPTSGGQ
jgi:RHS repeat-associated protein